MNRLRAVGLKRAGAETDGSAQSWTVYGGVNYITLAATHWEGCYAKVIISDKLRVRGHAGQRDYTIPIRSEVLRNACEIDPSFNRKPKACAFRSSDANSSGDAGASGFGLNDREASVNASLFPTRS